MDDQLRRFMEKLGNAINDSISESDAIVEAIGEIRKAGYDVFLVIEGTIGFSKREKSEETKEDSQKKEQIKKFDESHQGKEPKIEFTFQDHRFMKANGIVDPDKKR